MLKAPGVHLMPSGPNEFGTKPGLLPPRPFLHRGRLVQDVDMPTPSMGGKVWLLAEKGVFVLQRGSGTLRTLAITHAGAGNLEAIDGIPDDRGFFPDHEMQAPVRAPDEADGPYLVRLKAYHTRNGRPFYRANPIVMGSWMLDAGFNHGLTIRAEGGHDSTSAIATVVWMPYRARA